MLGQVQQTYHDPLSFEPHNPNFSSGLSITRKPVKVDWWRHEHGWLMGFTLNIGVGK